MVKRSDGTRIPTSKDINIHINAVNSSVDDIKDSKYYERLCKAVAESRLQQQKHSVQDAVQQMVVYGLGSLEQPGSIHIRYQLGLAVLLKKSFRHLKTVPEAYDPVCSPLDKEILHALGFHLLTKNEHGRRIAKYPTLFYMPHCEVDLICSVLRENIDAGTLQNVLMLGNSFSQYADRYDNPNTKKNNDLKIIAQMYKDKKVIEIPLPDKDFDVTGAFNDLSLHIF